MKDKVLEFIKRRFKNDCKWLDGNCYYFAVILKDRFPEGEIYYDVIIGHFIFKYQDSLYDWSGLIEPSGQLVKWDVFDEYDHLQKNIVVRDCVL